MKEMQFTVERGGPLLPFLLEHVKGSRNHVKSLLARGQVQVCLLYTSPSPRDA